MVTTHNKRCHLLYIQYIMLVMYNKHCYFTNLLTDDAYNA
jgi:hypothetical protein